MQSLRECSRAMVIGEGETGGAVYDFVPIRESFDAVAMQRHVDSAKVADGSSEVVDNSRVVSDSI